MKKKQLWNYIKLSINESEERTTIAKMIKGIMEQLKRFKSNILEENKKQIVPLQPLSMEEM